MPQDPAAQATRLATAVSVLRSRHERVTLARLAVLDVLDGTDDHLSAEDVVARATERAPHIHRATVYRALATLGDLGLVAHIHLGGSTTVYHLSVPVAPTGGSGEHVHLQCTRCGTVLDAPADTMNAVQERLAEDYGFRLDPGHTALLGTCRLCQGGSG